MKAFRPLIAALKSSTVALVLLSFIPLAHSQTQWLTPVPFPSALPEVRIISPANHATFYAPADVPVFVYASAFSPLFVSPFTNIEIFAGTNHIGTAQAISNSLPRNRLPPVPIVTPVVPEFSFVWKNPLPGTYDLRAVGTRNIRTNFTGPTPGTPILPPVYPPLLVTSAPVIITVMPPVPTATNRLDIVSVVATDPIAVEGTNCWITLGTTNPTPTWASWPPREFIRITNCGPKSATFTFRRYGDASADLTIPYTISGTASNGVDYAMISNGIVIPAGQSYAQTTIIPLDNTQSNVLSKTVVLSIFPPSYVSPPYASGFPSRAEAVIFEGLPRAVPLLPDRSFHVNAVGPDGAWFRVEYSSDLLNWTVVCTNQVVQGSIDFVVPNTADLSKRYYRAVPQ